MSLFSTIGSALNDLGTAAVAAAEASYQRKVDALTEAQASHQAAMTAYIERPGQYTASDLDTAAVRLMDAGRALMTANHHWAEPATFNSKVPTMAQQSRSDRPAAPAPRPRRVTVEVQCNQPLRVHAGPSYIRHDDDQICRYCDPTSPAYNEFQHGRR